MIKRAVITAIIATLVIPQVSLASESGKRNTAATLGALFGAVVGAVGANSMNKNGNQPVQQDNSKPIANVPKVSQESVNKLLLALQGREFKCRTAEAGVISLHFENGIGMILVNDDEKLATTNASLKDGKYRWYSPQYDKEYTAINSGSVLTSEIDGKVYRGAAIAVNSGNEITYLKCTRVIVNNLFDPLLADVEVAATAEEKTKKEKSGASKLWKSMKESTKNNSSQSNDLPD